MESNSWAGLYHFACSNLTISQSLHWQKSPSRISPDPVSRKKSKLSRQPISAQHEMSDQEWNSFNEWIEQHVVYIHVCTCIVIIVYLNYHFACSNLTISKSLHRQKIASRISPDPVRRKKSKLSCQPISAQHEMSDQEWNSFNEWIEQLVVCQWRI